MEAVLVLRSCRIMNPDSSGVRQGASEVIRQLCARPTTPGQGGIANLGGARVPDGREAQGTSCARWLKLEPRRQARAQPELNCRCKVVVRRRSEEPDLGRGRIQRSSATRVASPETE